MATKSALLPLLRSLSRPYFSIHKAPALSSLQSRLLHASTAPLRRISKLDRIHPLGGLQTISVLRLLKPGSPVNNCRHYGKDRRLGNEDDSDGDMADLKDDSEDDGQWKENLLDESDDAEGSEEISEEE